MLIGLSGLYLIYNSKILRPNINKMHNSCNKIKSHIPDNYNFKYKLNISPNILDK